MKRAYSYFEFKLADAPDSKNGVFEGFANAFCNCDGAGDIVCYGAFSDSLPAFLKDGFIGGINHDWDEPIGRPIAANEDAQGLYIKASLASTQSAQDARTLMQEGVLRKLSIGFKTLSCAWADGEAVRAYWDSVDYAPSAEDVNALEKALSYWGEVRMVQKAQLFEVSPVTLPANSQANIVAVKSDGRKTILPTEREMESFLRDAGFSRRDAQAVIADGYKSLLRDAGDEIKPTTTPAYAPQEEVQKAISEFMARKLAISQKGVERCLR